MGKNTKLTLSDLIARKETILQNKNAKKQGNLYVKSLDAVITIEAPSRALAKDAAEMEDVGEQYVAYSCVVEPNLKDRELQKAYNCVDPMDIVDIIFAPGEVTMIAQKCLELAGFMTGVKVIEDLKN